MAFKRSGVRSSLAPPVLQGLVFKGEPFFKTRSNLSLDRKKLFWGYSSVGRATGSQSVGQGFDPPYLHQFLKKETAFVVSFLFVLGSNQGSVLLRMFRSFLAQQLCFGQARCNARFVAVGKSPANICYCSRQKQFLKTVFALRAPLSTPIN